MSLAVFETLIQSDLTKPVQVMPLVGNFFSSDNEGNRITVEVFENGSPASLSGSVIGYIIRADNVTVTVNGTLTGNKASILLPASAYTVVGLISIVIKNGETTLGACTSYVYRTTTDTIYDPGHVVPSLEELLAKIGECESATINANNAAEAADSAVLAASSAVYSANAAVASANSAVLAAGSAVSLANSATLAASSAVYSANTAAGNANTATLAAESATAGANSATLAASSVISAASDVIESANSATLAAESATASANTATLAAQSAAEGANTATLAAVSSAALANEKAGEASTAILAAESATAGANTAALAAGSATASANAAATAIDGLAVVASTIQPSSPATATVSTESGHKKISFGIPQGFKGETGTGIYSITLNSDYTLTIQFTDGTSTTTSSIRGETGAVPSFTIGSVSTGAAGTSASVSITGTDQFPVLNFVIPKGDTGSGEGVPSGGTSGQVLKKHSGTDYDTEWGDEQSISGKADKVANATSGHVATLDGNGNLTDSGKTLGKSVPSNAVFTDTTYIAATQSADGLMSSEDKTKLDGVATGATAVTVIDNLTSTSTTSALSANQGKALNDKVITPHNFGSRYSYQDIGNAINDFVSSNLPSGGKQYAKFSTSADTDYWANYSVFHGNVSASSSTAWTALFSDVIGNIFSIGTYDGQHYSYNSVESFSNQVNGKLTGKMVSIGTGEYDYKWSNLIADSAWQPIFFTNWYDGTNFPTIYGSGIKYYAADSASDVLFYQNYEGRAWIRYIYGTDVGDTGWKEIITSGNIGSQSVNYATSAGQVVTSDSSFGTTQYTSHNTALGNRIIKQGNRIDASITIIADSGYSFPASTAIMTVPSGYRPSSNIKVPAMLQGSDGLWNAYEVWINSNGNVGQDWSNSCKGIYISASYLI